MKSITNCFSLCVRPLSTSVYIEFHADCGQVNYQCLYRDLLPAVSQTGTCSEYITGTIKAWRRIFMTLTYLTHVPHLDKGWVVYSFLCPGSHRIQSIIKIKQFSFYYKFMDLPVFPLFQTLYPRQHWATSPNIKFGWKRWNHYLTHVRFCNIAVMWNYNQNIYVLYLMYIKAVIYETIIWIYMWYIYVY